LASWWEDLPEIFTTSAVSGQGRNDLLAYIERTLVKDRVASEFESEPGGEPEDFAEDEV
jgi:hypothetical protein